MVYLYYIYIIFIYLFIYYIIFTLYFVDVGSSTYGVSFMDHPVHAETKHILKAHFHMTQVVWPQLIGEVGRFQTTCCQNSQYALSQKS